MPQDLEEKKINDFNLPLDSKENRELKEIEDKNNHESILALLSEKDNEILELKKEIDELKEKKDYHYPIRIFYEGEDQSEINLIFQSLEKEYELKQRGFNFEFFIPSEHQLSEQEVIGPCFYVYASKSKDRLEGYDPEILNNLVKITKGNVIMICILKINNPKTVKTLFYPNDLEELNINSGLNVFGENKDLMVPRFIFGDNGKQLSDCDQNNQNFILLKKALNYMLNPKKENEPV